MRRSFAILGLFATLGLVAYESKGQCNFTNTGCDTPGTVRMCYRSGSITGAAVCTTENVAPPATMFMFETSSSTFIMATCSGPAANTAGICTFQGCGVCGTFRVDMATGMPVELMDFAIEGEAAEGPEDETGSESETSSSGE